MIHLEVAVPTPLPQTFTYLAEGAVAPGSRVLVPFGRRRLVGVALGVAPEPPEEQRGKLKQVEAVIDATPVYGPEMLEIARWISTYYMHPLGEVLRAMLPASSTKVVKESCELTAAGQAARAEAAPPYGPLLTKLFGKKKESIAAATLKAKLTKLAGEGDLAASGVAVKDLARAGLITMTRGTSMRAKRAPGATAATGATETLPVVAASASQSLPTLTAAQAAAVAAIVRQGLADSDRKKVFLLHGVTGSGKTEVYLRLIAETLARSDGKAQTLVLVPEISLTPQMTRVFESRFPGAVAVVHSAFTDADRWAELGRIRSGAAKILIGPRSAVFGPFQRLGLLIVDEEHDHSYKQATGLTYNGRDVAVLRGRLEGVPVVLGSATPSMESYNNALTGRYILLPLPERVTGRPLPDVEVIVGDRSGRQGTLVGGPGRGRGEPLVDPDAEIPIDPKIVAALRENLAQGRQAIVLVNRRGYAFYLFAVEQKQPVQCPYCSISLTLHARSTVLRCHYCDYQQKVADVMRERPDETFVAVGYGSQKAEDSLTRLLPNARIVRVDSDTVTQRDVLPRVLAEFRRGGIDILVGTQILAKGHDFPNVTLIVILEVDQLLGLPDFRAGERTFQLVVQAAGRAGRAELPGRVLVQTLRAGHPVVTMALGQDYQAFAARELDFRRQHAYPPFARMIAFDFNAPDPAELAALCRRIAGWVEQMSAARRDLVSKVRILGPSVPPIERVRSRYRRVVIFVGAEVEVLRAVVGMFVQAFQRLPGDVRMRVDVDPQSLI
jgi:primosomal protein N' (replication factor Y)